MVSQTERIHLAAHVLNLHANAYGYRTANFSVSAFGTSRDRLNALWDRMAVHFTGLYLSFETDVRPKRLFDVFPPRTLARLRELKRRYDPDNLFRDNFNIARIPGNWPMRRWL